MYRVLQEKYAKREKKWCFKKSISISIEKSPILYDKVGLMADFSKPRLSSNVINVTTKWFLDTKRLSILLDQNGNLSFFRDTVKNDSFAEKLEQ